MEIKIAEEFCLQSKWEKETFTTHVVLECVQLISDVISEQR